MKNLIKKILKENDFDWIKNYETVDDISYVLNHHFKPLEKYMPTQKQVPHSHTVDRDIGVKLKRYAENKGWIEIWFEWIYEKEFNKEFNKLIEELQDYKSLYGLEYEVKILSDEDRNYYKRADVPASIKNWYKKYGRKVISIEKLNEKSN